MPVWSHSKPRRGSQHCHGHRDRRGHPARHVRGQSTRLRGFQFQTADR
jgi:hypothetical protein